MSSVYFTLDEICAELRTRLGTEYTITSREHSWGTAEYELSIDGITRATWKSRLVGPIVLDGVTPRGPSEYYDLKFN